MSDIEKFPTRAQRELLRVVIAARKSGVRDIPGVVREMMPGAPAREIIASVVAVLDSAGMLPGDTLDSVIDRLRALYREAEEDEDDLDLDTPDDEVDDRY